MTVAFRMSRSLHQINHFINYILMSSFLVTLISSDFILILTHTVSNVSHGIASI